ELEIDQRDLEAIMDELGLAKDALKQGAAWVAEKLGRLKLNGQIVGYSDLSRLVELEGLAIGIEGKMSLWRSLLHLVDRESTISEDVVAAALARAEKQRAAVEEQRLEAAAVALSGSADPAS
ncbi:MAG TPA: hypothetical protein VFS18_04910, partial [Actinomycetota bacterium]|nr:hypothetical protein [Actinomycetota bacterium]